MKIYIPFFIFLLLGTSCRKILLGQDDELSLQRQDYYGKELRLDGIYYHEIVGGEYRIYQRYALFRNGVIRDLGGTKEIDDPRIPSGSYKDEWGVFQINNNEIKFERWIPSAGGGINPAYLSSGTIINDSTFQITQRYRNQNGQKTEVSAEYEIYHFKAFSPKPDSTNSFIK